MNIIYLTTRKFVKSVEKMEKFRSIHIRIIFASRAVGNGALENQQFFME